MARYVYNAGLVNEAISKLSEAKSVISDVNGSIEVGISKIAVYLNGDFGGILNYKTAAEELIDSTISLINEKVQLIEEYSSAPWYKKIFATREMVNLKILEGIGTAVEQIGDGVVSVVGFVGGLVGADEFKESFAEYIKKDHVGDWFFEQYETGVFSDVAKYSIMSHTGTAANIFKTAGVVTGMIAATALTGGSNTAGMVIGAVSGFGSGTERALQSGKTFEQALWSGAGQATFNTAVAYGATKIFSSGAPAAASAGDDAANSLIGLPSGSGSTTALLSSGADDGVLALTSGASTIDDVATGVAGTVDDVVSSSVGATDDVISGVADDVVSTSGSVVDDTMSGASSVADDFVDSAGDVVNITTKDGDTVRVLGEHVAKDGRVGYKVEVVTKDGSSYSDIILEGRSAVHGTVDDFYNVTKISPLSSSATSSASTLSAVSSTADDIVLGLPGEVSAATTTAATTSASNGASGVSNLVGKGLVAGDAYLQYDNQAAKTDYKLDNLDLIDSEVTQLETGEVSAVPITTSTDEIVSENTDSFVNSDSIADSGISEDVNSSIPSGNTTHSYVGNSGPSVVPSYSGGNSSSTNNGSGNESVSVDSLGSSSETSDSVDSGNDTYYKEDVVSSDKVYVSKDDSADVTTDFDDSVIEEDSTLLDEDIVDEVIESDEVIVDDMYSDSTIESDSGNKSNVLKTVLGVGGVAAAATAVGIGGKKYVDKAKKNNSFDEDEE